MESVEPELLEAVAEQNGREPDNFVESAELTMVGLPDLDADPEAKRVVDGIQEDIDELIRERTNGANGASTNGGHPDADPSDTADADE